MEYRVVIASGKEGAGCGRERGKGGFIWWTEVEAVSYCFNGPPAFQ